MNIFRRFFTYIFQMFICSTYAPPIFPCSRRIVDMEVFLQNFQTEEKSIHTIRSNYFQEYIYINRYTVKKPVFGHFWPFWVIFGGYPPKTRFLRFLENFFDFFVNFPTPSKNRRYEGFFAEF